MAIILMQSIDRNVLMALGRMSDVGTNFPTIITIGRACPELNMARLMDSLNKLSEKGLVTQEGKYQYPLTQAGREEYRNLVKEGRK